ncbi:TetR/AcrR family transcriptional regulator [Paenibacillus cellulosilyticus]|nr:TetR/AcrR family transcriptional regulator [Paenibacillus cellulosilyticus]QKS45817.1 TetR/AcrR family transcriptional regulator [Paenibacillus cellulosilyticus]
MSDNTNEDQQTGTRRRGSVLEEAILQAAWDELNELGYARLSMEGVAARAQTNKNAVYRRWPNKVKLITAALIQFAPKPSLTVPDTGNLRLDLITLLGGIMMPLQLIGAETIRGIMADAGQEKLAALPSHIGPRSEQKLPALIKSILENAEKRGEVTNVQAIRPRALSVPVDLIRYEFLTTHEPISDQAIEEIVDEIFLPIVMK